MNEIMDILVTTEPTFYGQTLAVVLDGVRFVRAERHILEVTLRWPPVL
jgi:hypothetical protein